MCHRSSAPATMSTMVGPSETNGGNDNSLPAGLLGPDGQPDYLRMILTSRVYDVCDETPCDSAQGLSEVLGAEVYLKREDLQPVFSFKLRGAYNMMAQLQPSERWKGVISTSAGNHAQGVAYSARKLGIPATIVMPKGTPAIKVDNVRRLGAKVVLHGDDFDGAKAEGIRLTELHGLTYIPPFDNPYVIAGQGTIGLEVLRQIDVQKLRAIVCGIGGGGLIAGIGAYIKRIAPHVKLIGVETNDADAMYRSLEQEHLVTLKEVGLFADGTAVKVPGVEPFRLASEYVDEIVLVDTDEICAAIRDVFNDTRSVMEPSGAMSVAGLKKYLQLHPEEQGKPDSAYCCVLSGANMNFDRLRFVAERARLGAGKEVFFIVEMPETPGSFRKLTTTLMPRAITEFAYRYRGDTKNANVYISFTVSDRGEIPAIMEKIVALGMKVHDVSDNDLAKLHARYLVGGSAKLPTERLFKFEFPERPGALQRFLDSLQLSVNISLFHYRDYGSDLASVLAGIQASESEQPELLATLDKLGFPHKEETDNIAYKLFIQ